MKKSCFAVAALLLFASATLAQQNAPEQKPSAAPSANPITDTVRRLVTTMSKNIEAGAAEMPLEKYNFRPTPGQNSFGHLIGHMIQANYFFCSALSGQEMPKFARPQDSDSKDTLTAELTSSFDFCKDGLANLHDADLTQPVKIGPPGGTRGSLLITFAQDYGDHYAQESAYLRAAGLLPPTASAGRGEPGR